MWHGGGVNRHRDRLRRSHVDVGDGGGFPDGVVGPRPRPKVGRDVVLLGIRHVPGGA